MELGDEELGDVELGGVELGGVELGYAELGLLDGVPLPDVAPLAFFSTKPPPALAEPLDACCTQPVIVTGDPYVELVA